MFPLEEKKTEGQLASSTSVSKETLKESTLKGGQRQMDVWQEEEGVVCLGEGMGLQSPHPKNVFSFRVEDFIIYIYEYIDNTTDKDVCKSIYFHYIDSYEGRKDTQTFCLSLVQEEICWSWSPTLQQLCSGQRPLRNLQTQKQTQVDSLAVFSSTDEVLHQQVV